MFVNVILVWDHRLLSPEGSMSMVLCSPVICQIFLTWSSVNFNKLRVINYCPTMPEQFSFCMSTVLQLCIICHSTNNPVQPGHLYIYNYALFRGLPFIINLTIYLFS